MSFLGGIVKSVINPVSLMQVAMGPAGWASLAAKAIMTAVAKEVIQQVGQKLGLPQSVISMAHDAFSAATGSAGGPVSGFAVGAQLTEEIGLSATAAGALQRAIGETRDGVQSIVDGMMKRGVSGSEETEEGGSVLMRIARALGKVMDNKMDAMATKGSELGNLGSQGALTEKGNFNAKGTSQYGKVSGEMQALGQELSILSNALASTLKSIGEGSATLARKG